MTQSMTAFARGQRDTPLGKLSVEVRSVNNRFLDLGLRLADAVKSCEPLLRERIAARVKRGRVEISLRLDTSEADNDDTQVDLKQLARVAELQDQVRKVVPGSKRLSVRELLDWPGVVLHQETGDDVLESHVGALMDEALDEFVATRRREGSRLAETISQRIDAARQLVVNLEAVLPDIQRHVRERLNARLAEILERVDPDRLEQEVVLLLNKSDVEEEIDRLKIHFDEVVNVLKQRDPVGRRLDFLMQELNREANTLGSKAAHADVTNTSMELKVLIEQMREQVQNIE